MTRRSWRTATCPRGWRPIARAPARCYLRTREPSFAAASKAWRSNIAGQSIGWRQFWGHDFKTIHVVGGGSKNALLCQFTADACGRPVHAGPAEATAIGNILMQAVGRGQLGSIADLRAVVAHSFPVKIYEPRDQPDGSTR